MAKLFGLARIGRDVEIRSTNTGESVASLSLAFTYRAKGEKCTQWVDAALWGKRADALAPYLLKGGLISVTLEDVHIETYRKNDGGEGVKLAGRVMDIELAGGRDAQATPAAPQQRSTRPSHDAAIARSPAPAKVSSGFDDMDSDIPF